MKKNKRQRNDIEQTTAQLMATVVLFAGFKMGPLIINNKK
jgi:hypothetical protein